MLNLLSSKSTTIFFNYKMTWSLKNFNWYVIGAILDSFKLTFLHFFFINSNRHLNLFSMSHFFFFSHFTPLKLNNNVASKEHRILFSLFTNFVFLFKNLVCVFQLYLFMINNFFLYFFIWLTMTCLLLVEESLLFVEYKLFAQVTHFSSSIFF